MFDTPALEKLYILHRISNMSDSSFIEGNMVNSSDMPYQCNIAEIDVSSAGILMSVFCQE